MCMSDSIGDLITRIRNGQMAMKKTVDSPVSSQRLNLLRVLQNEGYIRGFSVIDGPDGHKAVRVELKYYDGDPVIKTIKRVSTPGRRVYSSINDLPLVRNGLGVNILSTSKGVMSDIEARKLSIGGEILCTVF